MRKLSFLFLVAALSLISTATFAQEIKEEVKVVAQEEAVEIKLSELPEAVTKALGEQFAEHTAEKAYKAKKDGKDIFQVKLEKDGSYTMVHFSAEGEVLGQEDIEGKS